MSARQSFPVSELNSLVYGCLVNAKCFKTAAIFYEEINYNVIPDSVEAAEDFCHFYRSRCISCHKGRDASETRKRMSSTVEQSPKKRKHQQLSINLSSDTPKAGLVQTVVYSALIVYKRLYGDVKVPNIFSISKNDVNFPRKSWE